MDHRRIRRSARYPAPPTPRRGTYLPPPGSSQRVASTPSVVTVGVSGVSTTDADLIGSVNPHGVIAGFGPINLASDPSFEYDTTNATPNTWITYGVPSPSVLTVQTSWEASGTKALRVTSPTITTANTLCGTISPAIPVSQSSNFALSVVVNALALTGTTTATVGIFWNNRADLGLQNFLSSTQLGIQTLTVNNIAPPAGALGGTMQIFVGFNSQLNGSANAAGDAYFDAIILSTSSPASTYFDGDSLGYGWGGTLGNSMSQKMGTWGWFEYGTTPALGTRTPAQTLGAGATETVTAEISGLSPGQTYYYAAVGSTAAGTVYGTTLSFVTPLIETVAVAGATPPATPVVTIPHFAVPFFLAASGANVNEQSSEEEILGCVRAIMDCPVGACPELPQFGFPLPTFGQAPLNPNALLDAVRQYEPRATATAVSRILADGYNWGISLTVAPSPRIGTET